MQNDIIPLFGKEKLTEALELLVDRFSMQTILKNLVEVCDLKTEHLLTNWQDQNSASVWMRVSHLLENAANSQSVKLLP